ncbi:WG containing repeat-containing protein [Prosthecobacter debontii]|uniref:WG containing repeat-containing protein n=1 Tax=Prosthecobacter debontii TaxID=48467 RepID=A0A1T4XIV0_9BACT|nr:WG repeat-containing protein [Prosthecobacter debontii]SKA89343.1 WG containing repeat-containing protein [Prosthecobacter debontii]
MKLIFGLAFICTTIFAVSTETPVVVRDEYQQLYGALTPNGFIGNRSWNSMGRFSEGVCAVAEEFGGPWGIIDQTGKLVIQLVFDKIGECKEGLIPVEKGNLRSYLKADGSVGIEFKDEVEEIRSFSAGRAAVKKSGLFGYIGRDGNFVIPPSYEEARPFSVDNNLAAVKINGRWGWVDSKGELIILPQWSNVGDFNGGCAPAQKEKDGAWGYIDVKGNPVIEARYAEAANFKDGYADVNFQGKWCLINTRGELESGIQADEVWGPVQGLSKFRIENSRIGDHYGLAHPDGTVILAARWRQILLDRSSYVAIQSDTGHEGFANGMFAIVTKNGDASRFYSMPEEIYPSTNPPMKSNRSGPIIGIATGLKSNFVLTAHKGGVGDLWKWESGGLKAIRTFERAGRDIIGHLGGVDDGVTSCILSPNGDIAVFGRRDGYVLYDTATGHKINQTRGGGESFSFSPSGKMFLMDDELYETNSGQRVATLKLMGEAQDVQWVKDDELWVVTWTTVDEMVLNAAGIEKMERLPSHLAHYDLRALNTEDPNNLFPEIEPDRYRELKPGACSIRISPGKTRIGVAYHNPAMITIHSCVDLSRGSKLDMSDAVNSEKWKTRSDIFEDYSTEDGAYLGKPTLAWMNDSTIACSGLWEVKDGSVWTSLIRLWHDAELEGSGEGGWFLRDLPIADGPIARISSLGEGLLIYSNSNGKVGCVGKGIDGRFYSKLLGD